MGINRRGHEAGFLASDRQRDRITGNISVEDVNEQLNGPV